MEIYIMRHGETDLNKKKRLQGRADIPLNKKGKEQALQAGKEIQEKGLRFDRVFCSPLDRSLETAELVTGLERGSFEIDDRLLEIDYGPYDELPIYKLNRKVISFLMNPATVDAPEGIESVDDIYKRATSFFDELKENSEESVLIVTHGIAMRSMLGYLSGKDSRELWKDKQWIENCALYHASCSSDGYTEPELC